MTTASTQSINIATGSTRNKRDKTGYLFVLHGYYIYIYVYSQNAILAIDKSGLFSAKLADYHGEYQTNNKPGDNLIQVMKHGFEHQHPHHGC